MGYEHQQHIKQEKERVVYAFAFVRPSAVLPLARLKNKRFDMSTSYRINGAPDFEYLIHLRPYQVHGYTDLSLINFVLAQNCCTRTYVLL